MTANSNIDKSETLQVHLDTIPNLLKVQGQEEKVKNMLRDKFEKGINAMIMRYRELPAIIVEYGRYSNLLLEARQLYLEGKYYSCVAMCGITAERIAKEVLRKNLLIRKKKDEWNSPSDEQSEILDRIDMNSIRELLVKSGIVDNSLRKPFQSLAELRNKYSHATGDSPNDDAKSAIEYLHQIIDGTVSVFVNYDISDGTFILKQTNLKK